MKYFTKSQMEEIRQRLATMAVRDSDLEETYEVKEDDFLAIVQDMENRRISLEVLGEAFTKGEPGPPGPQGPPGQDGQDGADGINGSDGADGFSPVVTVSPITGGHRVTITDATGTQSFDVMDGHDGSGSSVNVVDNLNSTSATDALSANQGRILKELINSGFLFKGVATTSTNPGTVTQKQFYLAGAGTYSNFGNGLTVGDGYIGVLMWDNGWTVSTLAVGTGGGGMNYQKVTSAEYEAMDQAGTLQSNILYVIVDVPSVT